jgi:AcrR family transcriptional regulator
MGQKKKNEAPPTREERIGLIVDAAERVFLRVDFPQASMSEIADEARISRPTLYKYFPSIDDLALAVQMRALDAIYGSLAEVLDREGRGLEVLEELLRDLVAGFDANRAHLRFMGLFDHYYHESYAGEGMAERYADYLGRFDQVEELIARGVRDGSVRVDIDAHNAAYMAGNALLSMMQMMAARGEIIEREQRVEIGAQFEELIAMVLRYAAADKDGPKPQKKPENRGSWQAAKGSGKARRKS